MISAVDDRTDQERLIARDPTFPVDLEPGNPFAFPTKVVVPEASGKGVRVDAGSGQAATAAGALPEVGTSQERVLRAAAARVNQYPDNPQALINLALAYLNTGDIDRATSTLVDVLRLIPDSFVARANLAKARFIQGDVEDAHRLYEQLATEQPNNLGLRMNLASVHVVRGEFRDAVGDLDSIIRSADHDTHGDVLSAAYHNRAVAYLVLRHFDKSVADFRRALTIDPRMASAYNGLGVCYALAGSKDKAIRAFRSALTLDPNLAEAIKSLASVYVAAQRLREAQDLLGYFLVSHADDIEARELLARAHTESKDWQAAISQLHQALDQSIKQDKGLIERARLLNNLGTVYLCVNELERAEELFLRSLDLGPGAHPVPSVNLANLYFQVGRFARASQVLNELRQKFPDDRNGKLLQARLYSVREEYEPAVTTLLEMLRVNPNDPVPYAELGHIYSEGLGDYERAAEVLWRGKKVAPNHLGVTNNLAYVLLMRGDIQGARGILDGFRGGDDNVFLTATRGLLLIREGDMQEGARLYNRAADLAQSAELRALVQQKKRVEIARKYIDDGRISKAGDLLGEAIRITSRSRIYARQAEALLAKISEA